MKGFEGLYSAPGSGSVPERLSSMAATVIEVARGIMDAGHRVWPVCIAIGPKGLGLTVPMPGYDSDSAKRLIYAHFMKTARLAHMMGLIFVQDTWLVIAPHSEYEPGVSPPPSEHPNRQEALTVVATTPDRSWRSVTVISYKRAGNRIEWGEMHIVSGAFLSVPLIGEPLEMPRGDQ